MLMFPDGAKDFWDFMGLEAKNFRQAHWAEPEFCFKVIACDVDMRRLSRFTGIKVESIGTFT